MLFSYFHSASLWVLFAFFNIQGGNLLTGPIPRFARNVKKNQDTDDEPGAGPNCSFFNLLGIFSKKPRNAINFERVLKVETISLRECILFTIFITLFFRGISLINEIAFR